MMVTILTFNLKLSPKRRPKFVFDNFFALSAKPSTSLESRDKLDFLFAKSLFIFNRVKIKFNNL